MLKRTINTSEVEERYNKASRELTAFKKHITQAIGEYESSWYYQWYLDGKEIDPKNLTDYHPRVKNVTQLKSIISESKEAAKLADDLVEYVDGSNDNFSWAWFSPLRDYVRYAVEDYSYSDLQSYDADMKLYVNLDPKTPVTKVSGDEYQTQPTDILQKSLESNEQFQVGPSLEKKTSDALSYHNLTIKLAKTNKEKTELQQKVEKQEAIIQDQESLIKLLRDIISELLIQITTFREVAHSVVGVFGDILAQIGEYFNLKSERENQAKSRLVSNGQYLDHEDSSPSTPTRSEHSESNIVTPSTVDRLGRNWQNALPLWLNDVGVKNIDDFEAASSDLNLAIFTAEGSASVVNDSSVYNPDMTYEYLDYRSGMEAAVTEQIEQKVELDLDLQATVQRSEELALENEQLRRELEQARQQLAQQIPSSSDSQSDNAAPPPPPPPGAPPPPAAKPVTAAAPLRFFRKKKEGEEADPGLPKPNIDGEPVTPTVSTAATTNVATDFKDELNSKVKARLTKTGIKFTPDKKPIYGHQHDPRFNAALANRYRAIYAQSPKKSPSQKTPDTPINTGGKEDPNSSLNSTF